MTEMISLKFLRGESSYTLSIEANATLKTLKEKVSEVSGIDVAKVQLIYSGTLLREEEKTLNELKLKDGLTLHLFEGNAPRERTADPIQRPVSTITTGSIVHTSPSLPPLRPDVENLVSRFESLSDERRNRVEGSSLISTRSIEREAFDDVINSITQNIHSLKSSLTSSSSSSSSTTQDEDSTSRGEADAMRVMYKCLEITKINVLQTARAIRENKEEESKNQQMKLLAKQLRTLSEMSLQMRRALENVTSLGNDLVIE